MAIVPMWPAPSQPIRIGRIQALTMVMVYALFAMLWILLSDKAVGWLFHDPVHATLVGTLKGLLFVAITALLLYGLLRRLSGGKAVDPARVQGPPALVAALIMGAIVVVTAAGLAHIVQHHHERELIRLRIIADLKSRQITDWLRERQRDVEWVRNDLRLAARYRRWPGSGEGMVGDGMREVIEQSPLMRGFRTIMLLDPEGHPLPGGSNAAPLPPQLRAAALAGARDDGIHPVGPFLGADGQPQLAFVTPIRAGAGSGPMLVLVLQIGLADWLYPILQDWPIPSDTGETLLFRRDGDHVLFLNELRHQKGTALRLRIPMTESDLMAVQGMRGAAHQGRELFGIDYRRVAIMGVVQSIPGTDWFLGAKLDRAELYNGIFRDGVWIVLAGLLAQLATAAAIALLRQRQQLALAVGVQQVQEERLQALRLLAAIADSSDDAIFAKDREGRYILFNRAASRIVGQPAAAVLGQDDRAIFPADQAATQMASHRRMLTETIGVIQEETLDTSQGSRVFLTTKGPLRDDAGQVIGTFGIARDITEFKQDERALRDSEARFRTLFDTASVAFMIHDRDSGAILDANRRAIESHGCTTLAELRQHDAWLEPPFTAANARALIRKAAREGPQCVEWQSRLRQGKVIWEDVQLIPITLDGVKRILSVAFNITARKNAEEALLRQSAEAIERNRELERFNQAMVGRELYMIELKQQVNALSQALGWPEPYPLAFLDAPSSGWREGAS
ncbi:MAG: PAS domain S-box protein [Magnetococcales bacterium]|nr:PAS domain S-box protein [Magnetococcales bacterium]